MIGRKLKSIFYRFLNKDMSTQQMAEQIDHLKPTDRRLAEDFIEFLSNRERKKIEPPKFTWEGGLEELKDEYTSVELQKKALEWM
jgi:hypothetical protein